MGLSPQSLAIPTMKFPSLLTVAFSIASVRSVPILSYDLAHAKNAPQTCDINSRIMYLDLALERTFRKHKGIVGNHNYWSNAGWINYNIMESILNALVMFPRFTDDNENFSLRTRVNDGTVVSEFVTNLYEENFGDFGTDDYGWKALLALAIWRYELDKGSDSASKWFQEAKTIFDLFIATKWDKTEGQGGVWWKETATGYHSTISTELFVTIAAQLHDGGADGDYLDQAIKGWEWLTSFPDLRTSEGLFRDGYGNTIDHHTYSYNQGVILSGLGYLYKSTGNQSYVDAGVELIYAVYGENGITDGLVVADECDKTTISQLKSKNAGNNVKIEYCSPDGSYFKGVFMKHLTYFFELVPANASEPFRDFVQANDNGAWSAALNDDKDGFSNIWIGTDTEGFIDELDHKNIGESTGQAFDAAVAGIKYGNKYGC